MTIYIRPQRYTREFLDANDRFTLSFYDPQYKDALRYLGRTSGRDTYKATHVGFTPAYVDGTVTFEQASLTLVSASSTPTPSSPSASSLRASTSATIPRRTTTS